MVACRVAGYLLSSCKGSARAPRVMGCGWPEGSEGLVGGAGCLRGREGGAAVGRVGGLGRVLKGHTGGPESGRRGPAGPQSPAHCPQASWRFERRSRTTVRSAALPSSPTPTAWWPSEDRRTSTGATGARWRVWTGGRKGAGWGGTPGSERGLRPVTGESVFLQCVRGRTRRDHPCGARVHRRLPHHRADVCG